MKLIIKSEAWLILIVTLQRVTESVTFLQYPSRIFQSYWGIGLINKEIP